jgi:asparagine synthase (glutamine-hydrolysing)
MCGIVGFIHNNKTISEDDLKNMAQTITYRGPDDQGFFLKNSNDFQVGMGFNRLAILDLSPRGHQPMFFNDLVITFNGEIYNFQEIRTELRDLGYAFESNCDTEVILKAFHCWKTDMVNRFIGMFAFAIFNQNTRELYLYRDRMGIKPLYYYFENNNLVYASELKPIMAYPGFKKRINKDSLSSYLYHGYITGSASIFENVYKLEPGCFLKYTNGEIQIKRYWDLKQKFMEGSAQKINHEEDCLNELDELLTSSVRYRMISDVPIGSFLSGGIDSSLITAIMQKSSMTPVNTFTIGFNEDSFNEGNDARRIAEHLRTNHHEEYLPIEKAKQLIEGLPEYYDEPFGDSSALPSILVSRLAKDKATVILTGDGGDELFCGYKNYRIAKEFSKYMPIGKILAGVNKIIPLDKMLFQINHRYSRYPHLNSNVNLINIGYIISKFQLADVLLNHEFLYDQRFFAVKNLTKNVQELNMLQNMLTYLPDDILTKVDRASMSISLESRVPLLDHRIVEFSFRIPHNFKNFNGTQKYLLKKLAYKYVPKEYLDRPKHGFSIPIFTWLKTDMKYLLDQYLSNEYISKQGLFNSQVITQLKKNFEKPENTAYMGHFLWNILSFQLWYKRYMQ